MSDSLTRRDFIKLSGAGAAVSLLAAGCGWLDLGETRSQGAQRKTTDDRRWIATTCVECPGGCGILAHKRADRLARLTGNPSHPLSAEDSCPYVLSALARVGLPGRFTVPLHRSRQGQTGLQAISWKDAVSAIAAAFRNYRADEIAFLLGTYPDHLSDLMQIIARALGGSSVLRFSPEVEFEGRVALIDATQNLFGVSKLPYFDLQRADLVLAFGASMTESWLFAGGCGSLAKPDKRVIWLDERPPRAQTGALEWIPTRPEGLPALAQAFAALAQGGEDGCVLPTNLGQAAQESNVSAAEILRLAGLFQRTERKIALPGSHALNGANGLAAAQAILALNALAGNLGRPGGLFFAPDSGLYPELPSQPSTTAEMGALIERMRAGQVKALIVHGVDPLSDLPAALGFESALRRVERLISFASLPNGLTDRADYVLPAPLPLESWGYQRSQPRSDRPLVSALQPVFPPPPGVRAMGDVLLEALRRVGSCLAEAPGFQSELDFVRQSALRLGRRNAKRPESSWQLWEQKGGWWSDQPMLAPPVPLGGVGRWTSLPDDSSDETHVRDSFRLRLEPIRFRSLSWGARKGQEGAATAVLHPHAARKLGLSRGQTVRVASPAGEIRAVLALNPSIKPDELVLFWEMQVASDVGSLPRPRANPLDLLSNAQNTCGSLIFQGVQARILPV